MVEVVEVELHLVLGDAPPSRPALRPGWPRRCGQSLPCVGIATSALLLGLLAKPVRSGPRPSGLRTDAAYSYHILASACKAESASVMLARVEAQRRLAGPCDGLRSSSATSRPASAHADARRHDLRCGAHRGRLVLHRLARRQRPCQRPRRHARAGAGGDGASSATSPMSRRARSRAAGPRPSACWRRRSTTPSSRPSSRASTRRSRRPTTTSCCARRTAAARRRRSTSRASPTAWSTACSSCCPRRLPDYVAQLRAERYPVRAHRPRQRGARAATSSTPPTGSGRARASPTSSASAIAASGSSPGDPTWGPRIERSRATGTRCADAGMPLDDRRSSWRATSWRQRGHAAAHRAARRCREPPTAIFASSDTAAFGVLSAARDARPRRARGPVRARASTTSPRRPGSAPACRPSASRCARWAGSPCGASSRRLADPSQPPAPRRHGDRARRAPHDRAATTGSRRDVTADAAIERSRATAAQPLTRARQVPTALRPVASIEDTVEGGESDVGEQGVIRRP